ncbi:MAG TPA: oligopeptide transporter, OPT family, partial [Thermoanaerobaculia bacterium]|nr:oligopeptide transporter, OPT family [Thermoanaerobaculia bacterium]
HKPYVASDAQMPEFTWRGLVPGILLGIVFGAANAYLGLKAGLTISTSIPIAVMTVAVYKLVRGNILEANMSQTIGSASSSVASGVIFTLPALFLWGLQPTLLQMTLLALAGGVLGTLFMIPLRKYLLEKEHATLPYPEGTACAEVLIASQGGGRARGVFEGLAVGAAFKALVGGFRVIPDEISTHVPFLRKGELATEVSAALFGVGYILGPRVGAVMVSGGLLSSLVIIPLIAYWGAGMTTPFFPELKLTIDQMSPGQLWSRYVRYIGAGAVATAGIITLIRSMPTMIESFRVGTAPMRKRASEHAVVARTSHDLQFSTTIVGSICVVALLATVPQAFGTLPEFTHRLVAAILVALFAFFFATVASRIVGLVGVTSNPTSGMTIAALLGTAAVFLAMGWTDMAGKAGALAIGTVVAISASIAGDTSQDLKTGYLLGATPRYQQIGQLLGVLTSATFVCLAVLMLGEAYGFGSKDIPAPQATLMKLVIEGVLDQTLPWMLVGIGAALTLVAAALRLPALAFAVGVYLPVAAMVPIFIGGIVRWFTDRGKDAKARGDQGVLLGSGLVGGEGLVGLVIAGVAVYLRRAPEGFGTAWLGGFDMVAGTLAFAALILWFVWSSRAAARAQGAATPPAS